jgi:hypothetical protein
VALNAFGIRDPATKYVWIPGTFLVFTSVAKGPKFRPQNTKGAEKNCVGPGKSGAELLADLSKKGRKGAELFCSLFLH